MTEPLPVPDLYELQKQATRQDLERLVLILAILVTLGLMVILLLRL
jgi:hypothetical protein